MTTADAMIDLYQRLAGNDPGVAECLWGGADVGITDTPPPAPAPDAFYPEPRWVVTPHALHLSWVFEALRDAFYAENRLDSCSKIEFFGRLANAANRQLAKKPDTTAVELCTTVFYEAATMLNEMDADQFQYLQIAAGNEILDDRRNG